jgi:phenylalanyl-tRNA synthetase beta chain
MAILEIKFNVIKEELNDKELSLEKLEEILFNFGLEIEGQEEDLLKIDITADRQDLLSPNGFLRAIKAYCNIPSQKEYSAKKSDYKVMVDRSVLEVRPHTVCAVIKNLNLNEEKLKEIINAQEKLHQTLGRKRKEGAIGIYPLSEINFPITYKAQEKEKISFAPLGFQEKMSFEDILQKTNPGKEYAHLVKDNSMCALFVDSKDNVMSIPPIINSQKTGEVKKSTKEVFIECSGNNLKRLNQLLNILVCMFIDLGGDAYSVTIEYPKKNLEAPNESTIARSLPYLIQEKFCVDYNQITPNLLEDKMMVSLENINKLIGINLDQKQAIELLERMLYKVRKKGKDQLEVLIPPYRADVLHEVDVADDVSRAYGFSNIVIKFPRISTIGRLTKKSIVQDNIISTMTGLGFQEVMTLTLSSKKEMIDNFCIDDKDVVKLGYSKDKTLDVIVSWLTPKLLKFLTNNQHMFYPQKIFSCDYVVIRDEKKDVLSKTKLSLAAMLSNPKISFSEMSSVLIGLCNTLGWKISLEEKEYPFYIKKRSARIVINDKEIGHIGEISPKVLKAFDYYMPVCSFEIDVEKIE